MRERNGELTLPVPWAEKLPNMISNFEQGLIVPTEIIDQARQR